MTAVPEIYVYKQKCTIIKEEIQFRAGIFIMEAGYSPTPK
jgi:hypothetical protein